MAQSPNPGVAKLTDSLRSEFAASTAMASPPWEHDELVAASLGGLRRPRRVRKFETF